MMTWRKFKNRLNKCIHSMTIWFNTTGAAILTATLFEPKFVEYMDTHNLSMVLIIGNIILRFKTNKDLADK